MKKILLAVILSGTFLFAVAQKNKIYATVLDEDNNPVARGLFKTAADSGIIILVDDMEIFVNATEITILKIEKDSSTSEFLKLGTTAVTDVVSYLVNKPKKGPEDISADSIPNGANIISTETKDTLLQRINKLVENLLSGKNDLATININNSAEKFISKLRLLQEYSMDKEIVQWNAYSINDQPANTIPYPQQDTMMQNGSVADSTSHTERITAIVPVTSKTVVLNKGFLFVKPVRAAVPATSLPSSNTTVVVQNKNTTIAAAKGSKQLFLNKSTAGTTTVKPTVNTATKNNAVMPASKTSAAPPVLKMPVQKKTKTQNIPQKKSIFPLKKLVINDR